MRIYLAADIHGSATAAQMIRDDLEQFRPDVFLAAGDVTHFGPVAFAEDLFRGLAVNLHGRKVVVGGHPFVGIGGANPTPFGTPFELSEEEIGSTLCDLMEPGAFLVSHAPPRGYVDAVLSGDHVGSIAVRQIIDDFEPPLVVCGHIHEARGVAHHGPTTIVNPGPAREGHRALIDVDDKMRVQLF